MRRLLLGLWIYVFPLVAPWAILLAVNASAPGVPLARAAVPREPFRADRCTWVCHNRGCRHRPVLPAVITGDRYLFGATIRGLYALGTLFSRDRFKGYGAANILVFCVAWPALMYALWAIAWRQREEIRRLRALDATTRGGAWWSASASGSTPPVSTFSCGSLSPSASPTATPTRCSSSCSGPR